MAVSEKKDKSSVWKNPWVRFFFSIIFIIFILWLLYYLRSILLPLLFAFVMAYILDPFVTKLTKPFLPRGLISAIIVIIAIFLFILIMTFILPQLFEQVIALAENLPKYLEKLKELIDPIIQKFEAEYPLELEKLSQSMSKELESKLPDIASNVTDFILDMFSNVVNFILSMIKLIVIPLFTFFLLKDIQKIRKTVKKYLPYRYKDRIIDLIRDVDNALGKYLRGQLLICLIVGFYYSICFVLIGVPFGLLLGIIIGVANFVPYLGIVIGVIPALLFTFLEYGTLTKVLLILVVYLIEQAVSGLFMTPAILGHQVGLHPVVILLSLMIFGKLFGILGILIAVPTTAVLKVLVRRTLNVYNAKQEALAKTKNGKL